MDIAKAQHALRKAGLPGWLLYGFFGNNPLALETLGLRGLHLSRRFAYLIPAEGDPVFIVHAIERANFPALPGRWVVYSSWSSFVGALQAHVAPLGRVAMEYHPGGGIPYLSRLDGGTLELLRGMGLEVVSSAELLLQFQTWDAEALASHRRAARGLEAAKDRGLEYIRSRLAGSPPPSELEVQAEILKVLHAHGLVWDHDANVSFGPNAANPHHSPDASRLESGQVVLFDIWAKEPSGPYADITWMAGWNVSGEVEDAFRVVMASRDKAVDYVREAYARGRHPRGYEVDREAREVLVAAGYAEHVLHRTGHNLGWDAAHGNGTHLDDLETHDTRPLIPGLAFTVEPGVYPGPFGLRSEINVYLHEHGPEVTTALQTEMDRL